MLYNIAYIGHLAQGKSTSCLHKGIPFHWTDPSEWDIAENTHEPIISMDLWEQVQRVNQSLSNAAKASHGKYGNLPKRKTPMAHCYAVRTADVLSSKFVLIVQAKRVEPKVITRTNVPDILNLAFQAVHKEVFVLPIWVQLYWRPFGNKWKSLWTGSGFCSI